MKTWTVLAIFAGVYPAAVVTLVRISLGRQTESVTHVASTVRDSCGHVLRHWKYGLTALVVSIQIVLLSMEPKQPIMNEEEKHGNFFLSKWRAHHLSCSSWEYV